MATATAREHIEEIRKNRFWIGVGENPLSKTVCMSVKYLSAELYSKDVHFLMELIQNAEDNEYPGGAEPSLEFIITSQDITATGAPTTLLIFNNEKGFSRKNMESICNVGDSTKAGKRKRGYIGEKGIGFKSVFLLTAQPYIFSNSYQIRFNETPCPECNIAYIVPEWVDSKPSVSDIQKIYGRSRTLPTTTIILPLKPDKVKAVKDQLSNLHPELLLFLSKIKRLSVKEDNMDPSLNTIRAISISSETDFVAKKNIDAESYTIHLTAEEEGDVMEGEECCYYMWKQRFPVKQENKVEKRMDIEEWAITLAFPYGKRLNRGMGSPGIYAFLPTETITNLPFIIQADFLLPSSRETILWDDKWNQGILDCVPVAFINAFVSLVKTREDAPASTLASMFDFLPVNTSSHPKLNTIRESIRGKLLQENIILSESHSKQKFFHKPGEVGRLMPSFWNILRKVKSQGEKLHNLSCKGKHILNSDFDKVKYDNVLNFLGIELVDYEWYPKCIQRCNLVLGVEEEVYKELLQFVAVNWKSHFDGTTMRSVPLLKYVGASGNVLLFSITEVRAQSTLWRSQDRDHISWLIDWSKEFNSAGKISFLPRRTQELCSGVHTLHVWFEDCVNVKTLSVYGYASVLLTSLGNNRVLVLAFAHFLYLSFSKGFLSQSEVKQLCSEMPLLNSHGGVSTRRKGVLVPANGSKYVELIGSNPWGNENYVELAEEYMHSRKYADQVIPRRVLINFLQSYAGASDIPDICPPDAAFPTVYGPLMKENVFLLLDWIRALRSKRVQVPSMFFNCIKNGSWLKVTMSGCHGYKPPSQSFLPSSSWGSFLQSGSEMVDIPLVDQEFYGYNKIRHYEAELKEIGVMCESGQACEFIGKHLMSLANNYNLTRTKVVAMLNFIKFLREKYLPVDEFIISIKHVKWVRTSCGERSPVESVLYDQSWKAALALSQIPFLDQEYYGKDIIAYKIELDLLGVMVGFKDNYQIVIDNLKPSVSLNFLMAEPLFFALKCIRHSRSSDKLVAALKTAKCLLTSTGYLCPGEGFLFDSEWGCILEVFEGFPYVDGGFYGEEIFRYKDELRKIGVVVDFDVASQAFFNKFRQRASSNSITKENVLSFLACYRKLREKLNALPPKVRSCIQETKWLRSRLGDCRSPADCIFFTPGWHHISQITLLPFIDDSDNCYGKDIHEYIDELKRMGVVVDFEKGAHFVLSNIFFPREPTSITPSSVISLLQCIRKTKPCVQKFPKPLLEKIHQTKWLKTTLGYMSPQESLLFDTKQKSSLQREDGPFIDEEFYGPLMSYKEELADIGVTVNMFCSNASSLLAGHIKTHSDFAKIERIYGFLSESDWKPGEGADNMIWVPTSSDDGTWVSPQECVLHDDNGLFITRLHVLDQKNYRVKLLIFFSKAFGVRTRPSTDDYCTLWKEWENSRPIISHEECYAFWRHVISHSSGKTEKMMSECVTKIPAVSDKSGDIHLINKQDVFLPDDLLLKDLLETSSPRALFVWCPRRNLPGFPRARLLDIYAKIGVRTISESVIMSELSSTLKCEELKKLNPKDVFIVKGLMMLILGFLSDPELNIEVKLRHEAVKELLKLHVFETTEPVTMSYSLKMTSGDVVEVTTSRMVRWERETSEFFTQKVVKSGGQKKMVEYATNFAEVVSQGLLWEKEDQIPRLSELIKFGFLMDFDEDAVSYFMKSKKLQIFEEDEEFLTSVFPSC